MVERADAAHRHILAALGRGDAEAARLAMAEHIAQSKRQAVERFAAGNGDGRAGTDHERLARELPDALLAHLDRIEQGGHIDA